MSKIARPIPQIQADNTTSLTDVNVLDLASTTEVYCRICFIEESSEQLLRPCNCKGNVLISDVTGVIDVCEKFDRLSLVFIHN